MAKTKKGREESSESEESTASSSSSESSSSESSSSGEEASKKRNSKKIKKVKSKKRRKEKSSSSSSSSSEESNGESTSTNEDEKTKKKKEKNKKSKDKKEAAAEPPKHPGHSKERRPVHSFRPEEEKPLRREVTDLQNRSKWDSPSNEAEEGRYERHRDRDRNYHDGYGRDNGERRGRRYDENNRRNEHRDRNTFRDRERRPDRERDVNNDRTRDRDQKPYRGRDNNYNERRYNNREDRERRDDRENRRSRSPRRPRNFPRRRSGEDRNYEWGKREHDDKDSKPPEDKEKPNFGLSGKLTEDANKVNGIVIKYAEPPEARKPKRRWRLYPFKGEKALPTLYIHRQSCYLIGRDRKVCDLPVDHPSCSKQHAAFQYRLVPFERDDGTVGKRVRPYIIDLESANGTFINNKKIDSKKYIELLEKDVIKFGFSSREYVLLHENSKEDQQDDDITEEVHVKEEPAD